MEVITMYHIWVMIGQIFVPFVSQKSQEMSPTFHYNLHCHIRFYLN